MKLAREDGDISLRHALAFMLAFLTGKGQAQILNLKRSQISEDGILFGKRKGGVATLVQWTSELHKYIDESLSMSSLTTPMHVVHTQNGGRYTSHGFKSGWQRLMKLWVTDGKWEDGKDRHAGERFTFHDSRAKAVTTTVESGRKPSELTGHKISKTAENIYDRRAVRKSPAAR